MAPPSSPRPVDTRARWRTSALLIGVVAEGVLLGAQAIAAFGHWQNEAWPPLSFGAGVRTIAIGGGVGTVFVVAASVSLASMRRWWGVVAAGALLAAAGVVGFLGFALTSLTRHELSDDA